MPDSTTIAHLREAGMQKCISLDVSNSFNTYGMYFNAVFFETFSHTCCIPFTCYLFDCKHTGKWYSMKHVKTTTI